MEITEEVKKAPQSNQDRFKAVIKVYGTMTKLSKAWGIPYRTIQNWNLGEHTLPDWQIDMFEFLADHDYKREV